jgi:plasmid stability protein
MTLVIELPDDQKTALAAKASCFGLSAEEYVRRIVTHDLEAPAPPHRPIWEVIAESMERVSPEDLAALSEDGLSQIDHYVYGAPKRDL